MLKQLRIIAAAAVVALASSVVQAADHPAQALVESAVSDILKVYQEESDRLISDPDYLQTKIDELIVPYLDFETMTKLAVSKFWRRADKDQQKQLVEEFTTLLKTTYTGALTEYSGETVSFEPFRPESREDRAVVRSTFSQATGSPIPILYRLRDKDGWSIYDIEVNDISLVTSYRSAFSNEIEQDGIDGLIQTLKERNGSS